MLMHGELFILSVSSAGKFLYKFVLPYAGEAWDQGYVRGYTVFCIWTYEHYSL